jgi:hypothetical protein
MLHQNRRKVSFEKGKRIIRHIHKGFTLAVADESIFTHDSLVRKKMWMQIESDQS